MARIDIKKLSKLVKAHQDAAEEFARFPSDEDARKKLSDAAFDYVIACVFADDGKDSPTNLAIVRSNDAMTMLRANPAAYAAAIRAQKRKPFDHIFELAGAVAPEPKAKKGKRK